MADLDTNAMIGYLGAAATAITTGGFALRTYFKRERVTDASDASVVKGFQSNDKVLANLVAEVERMGIRVSELENKVEHLTDKLAAVRLIALDCYQLANECDCEGDNRVLLLAHLKQIIKEA